MNENATDVRRRMTADRQRPLYHFLPPANWMNDPNGAIQWKVGDYHLFFQHNPYAPHSHRIHWGHTVSADLVHWRDLPVAIAPTPGATDDDGCWSGCAVDNAGTPTLVYTGRSGEHESVCLATGDAALLKWAKHPANPVIAGPPPGLDTVGFRDPYVWREGDEWRMTIGSGERGVGGMALLFRSADLLTWEYIGPLVRALLRQGTMWECPSFFRLADRWVLIYSPIPTGKVFYLVGDYEDNQFTPQSEGRVDWGSDFYAPHVMTDAAGRRIMFGWSWEARGGSAERAASWSPQPEVGWAGVQTLPRVLSLSPAGELLFDPIPQAASLRGAEHRLDGVNLASNSETSLPISGDHLELALTCAPGCGPFALKLRAAPDDAEYTTLAYDSAAQTLTLDRAHASLAPGTLHDAVTAPLVLADDEPLSLRVFLDASIIEVYANRRVCMTTRVYPTREDSIGLRLATGDQPVQFDQLVAWEMTAIWPTE